MTVNGLGLFVLYNLFPWRTAELKGCAYYRQRLTVVTILLVYPAVIDACGLSNKINTTLE